MCRCVQSQKLFTQLAVCDKSAAKVVISRSFQVKNYVNQSFQFGLIIRYFLLLSADETKNLMQVESIKTFRSGYHAKFCNKGFT